MMPTRHRVWAVASALLVLAAGVVLWSPRGWNHNEPAPLLSPAGISRAAGADTAPITNSFGTAEALPAALDDEAFRRMIVEFSEPGGYFRYENFLSNEGSYQNPIPALKKVAKPGGVYLGVGPEQNFTYIAALRPQMAFVIDIRRQNMLELLMYKALFGMAANRAEFVSLLFSRKSPIENARNSTAQELFQAYGSAPRDRSFFDSNLRRIKAQLRLNREDEKTIDYVFGVFFAMGPDLSYSSANSNAPLGPTYAGLMTMTDASGANWSYLATEENFRFVKEMQRKNLIVPVIGDFAGPKAIRTVGRYLKDHNATVSAFYLSNVEMYILPSAQWKSFCSNIAALPMDSSSTFIRFVLGVYARTAYPGVGPAAVSVISPMVDVLTSVVQGYPLSYYDLLHASK
jgi:hypothetical protein